MKNIETAIRDCIETHLIPHVASHYRWTILADVGEIDVEGYVENQPLQTARLLRVCFSDAKRNVDVSNIFLPPDLRKRNIGKTFLAELFKVAAAHKYRLFIVQLTSTFYTRLVNRGARVIVDEDMVEITAETNLTSRFNGTPPDDEE